jgi:hypothetical protein
MGKGGSQDNMLCKANHVVCIKANSEASYMLCLVAELVQPERMFEHWSTLGYACMVMMHLGLRMHGDDAPWATHAPWHRRQRFIVRVRHLHSFLCEETYSCYLLMLWRTPECRASNNSHGFFLKGCRTTMPAFFFESTGQTATPRAEKPRHLAHNQFSSCSSRLATETKTMETFSFERR